MSAVADDLGSTIGEFSTLFAKLQPAAGVQLDAATMSGILNVAGDNPEDKINALAAHVASNTPLTFAGARPLVSDAVTNTANNQDAAAQVSQQVAGLVGSADLELSNPIPFERLVPCRVRGCYGGGDNPCGRLHFHVSRQRHR